VKRESLCCQTQRRWGILRFAARDNFIIRDRNAFDRAAQRLVSQLCGRLALRLTAAFRKGDVSCRENYSLL
jgi:hypothetical protein